MGCGGEQELTACLGQREQAPEDEIVQRVRHWQGLPALDRDSGSLEHPHDLERVERIPVRCLMHLRESRARERDTELLEHHMVERTDVERPYIDVTEPHGGQRSRQLSDQEALEQNAAREKDPDALGSETSCRVGESGRRCRVQPLHVVDGDDQRPLLGEGAQRVQDCDADGVWVGRQALVVVQHQCAGERSFLSDGQWSQRFVENLVQQVADPGEAERRLALGRHCLQHPRAALFGNGDACSPDRRLSGAGVALEHER